MKRGDLKSQILIFRAEKLGHLSNRDHCGTIYYDLNDANVRTMLDSAYFVCTNGKKIYSICRDRAGLCRKTKQCQKWRKRFLRKNICVEYNVEFIDANDQNAETLGIECYSELFYDKN